MSHIHVQSPHEARGLENDLERQPRIALDCEAAGFHRYSDRLCLLQVTAGDNTYVLDPMAFDPGDILRGPLEQPELPVIMHGADFDLRLLSRDLGIKIRGLVDTQIYAALLGEDALGLASLLDSRLGVRLSKKYQRADWAKRPLTEGMLEYAADDTRHLEALVDVLANELDVRGRKAWADEECLALEAVAEETEVEAEPEDPVTRIKGARNLPPRHVTAIREALRWRDEIARRKDRAIFRVVGDKPLVEAVARRPRRVDELLEIGGFPKALAREEGKALLRRLRAVGEMPETDLEPYPRNVRRGPGRPPPELEAVVDRLKAVRNAVAGELDLPRGTLLSNAVVLDVARAAPESYDELLAVEGMRRWKADLLGDRFLRELERD